MISRVADNLTIQASKLASTTILSDPVALGDYNLGRAVLVVHQMTAPGSNTTQFSVTPQFSNDGVYWADDTAGVNITTMNPTDTVLGVAFNPECAYVRFKMVFNPSETGSDTGVGFVMFDLVVRYSNQ